MYDASGTIKKCVTYLKKNPCHKAYKVSKQQNSAVPFVDLGQSGDPFVVVVDGAIQLCLFSTVKI